MGWKKLISEYERLNDIKKNDIVDRFRKTQKQKQNKKKHKKNHAVTFIICKTFSSSFL